MRLGWRRIFAGIVAATVVCLTSAQPARGQTAPAERPLMAEEVFKNVQVFKGVPVDQFMGAMGYFSNALSANCTYCHVGEEGKPLGTYDFASDANPNKDRARGMLRMLKSVNEQLKAIPSSGGQRVNMWCHTCHAGRPRPMTLDEEMAIAYRKSGIDAAIARYRELRERYYGKAGYDFSDRTLNSIARDLLNEGNPDAAIAVLRLCTAEHPQSATAWDGLGEAYAAAGKPRIAEIYYRKSLEIDPANENALAKLEELEQKKPE